MPPKRMTDTEARRNLEKILADKDNLNPFGTAAGANAAKKSKEQAAAIKQLQIEVEDLTEQVEDHEERITELEAKVAALETADFQGQIDTINTTLASLQAAIDVINSVAFIIEATQVMYFNGTDAVTVQEQLDLIGPP